MAPFNVLTATATELQDLLMNGSLSSVDIVEQHLRHIEKHNGRLHALVDVVAEDRILSLAKQLDDERTKGSIRGPLHGIPMIVKDNIVTHPDLGLRTTGGSFAFVDLKPNKTAPCVQRLLNAGCIIIGKANLSELANAKGTHLPCGWSALGGQTQSPYVKGGWDPNEKFGGHSGPGGSSSGSATGVAAGFAPLSISSETWGSIIMPSSRANVFALKGSRDVMPMGGVMPVSDVFDIAGPMARCSIDIANAFDAMVGSSSPNRPKGGYVTKATGSWDDLHLGAVDTSNWRLDEDLAEPDDDWFRQQEHDLNSAYCKVRDLGVSIKHPVPFPKRGPLEAVMSDVINHNFVRCFDSFLAQMEFTSVKTVQELVEFNKTHANIEMPPEAPNQDVLLGALKIEPWTKRETLEKLKEGELYAGAGGIDRYFEENCIDILLGPADSWLTDFACVAGYPSAALPLSFWKTNGRAFGVIALARKHREDLLIQLMSAWETIFPCRTPPKL